MKHLFRALCLCVVSGLLLPNLSTADSATSGTVDTTVPLESSSESTPAKTSPPGESGRKKPVYEQDIFEHSFGPVMESAMEADDRKGFRWSILMSILAIILILGGPIAVTITLAILFYRARIHRTQMQSATVVRLLEAGREVPIELLCGDDLENAAANLRKGLKNIGLGLGVLIALSMLVNFGVGSLGFILIGLGTAQLLVWKMAERKAEMNIVPASPDRSMR